ncbi:DUF2000 domain-containing protein [Sodalis sp. RH21]|uniref:DUF2000 domain-containing protein n=1 Tax=unclassified Sodalis (in: enterobacteria) TaxID=2636512 RepID=UPI0039B541B5
MSSTSAVISNNVPDAIPNQPERCVIILNEALPAGKAVNAAAVIALTVGQRHPMLVGAPLIDADNMEYPGLIPIGIPVLSAPAQTLNALSDRCRQQGLDRVIFPLEGQATTDYAGFCQAVRALPSGEIQLLGIAIIGNKKAVRKLTARCALFG